MIEPMILPRLVSPADVIAETIVAEAMLQCKAGRRATDDFIPKRIRSKQRHRQRLHKNSSSVLPRGRITAWPKSWNQNERRKENGRHRCERRRQFVRSGSGVLY